MKIFLNIVTEFYPQNLSQVMYYFQKRKLQFPSLLTKLYTFQLLRAVAYMHHYKLCHRDLKPENILIDPPSQ